MWCKSPCSLWSSFDVGGIRWVRKGQNSIKHIFLHFAEHNSLTLLFPYSPQVNIEVCDSGSARISPSYCRGDILALGKPQPQHRYV